MVCLLFVVGGEVLSNAWPGPVVQKVDNAIHRMSHYPKGKLTLSVFFDTYPLNSKLYSEFNYPPFEQPGLNG